MPAGSKLLVVRQPNPFPVLIRDYSRRATETRSNRVTQNPPFPGDVDLALTRLVLRLFPAPVLPLPVLLFLTLTPLSPQWACLATPSRGDSNDVVFPSLDIVGLSYLF